ncbi:hypothetical protein Tco_0001119, partial [Tanacetum coccineum]
TTIKFIHVEVKCSSSPIYTGSDIFPIGHMISPLKPTRGTAARTIWLFTSGRSLLKQYSYSISEADPPSTYIRCMKWPLISASMIMGPSVSSSFPNGGNEISGSREKLCMILFMATFCHGWTIRIAMALSVFFRAWFEAATSPLRNAVVTLIMSSTDFGILSCSRLMSSWVGDFVHEFEDSHAFWGSLNMPTLSLKSLHKIFRGFPFSLLDVMDFYRIVDTLLLLKEVR